MGLYEKWLRLWADKPVLDLVELINKNPKFVRVRGTDYCVVGELWIFLGGSSTNVKVACEWYGGCNNALIRRALATALVKNQGK